MRVVVPFAAEQPKTRLASVLDPDERTAFARVLLGDVLDAIRATDREPTVLATADVDCDAPVSVDDRPLSEAVNGVLPGSPGDEPVAVVMADLALATPTAIRRLFAPDEDVVLAPGLGGGTNALVTRHPDFRADYHGASIRDHRSIARDVGASLATIDSFRLATDVDEPADLVEVLLHGEGDESSQRPREGEQREAPRREAAAWLREHGFELATADGRVDVRRSTDES